MTYRDRLKEAESLIRSHRPAVPSTIAREKESNIFLRADSVEQFAHLRGLKDRF
jgi:hydroxyacylglutathione hydrolase